MGDPTFSGASHGRSMASRRATQMSVPPSPPGRFEAKYSERPFAEIDGAASFGHGNVQVSDALTLTTGPRLTARDHGPNFVPSSSSSELNELPGFGGTDDAGSRRTAFGLAAASGTSDR